MKQSNFQMVNKPRVTKSIFELNQDFNTDEEVEINLEINSGLEIKKPIDNDNQAKVILYIGIFNECEFIDVPFKIEIVIEGDFIWGNEYLDKTKDLDCLLKQNAPAILYSYVRPIITAMTIEASISPLVIPIMNFKF